jgi:hypothetical protein
VLPCQPDDGKRAVLPGWDIALSRRHMRTSAMATWWVRPGTTKRHDRAPADSHAGPTTTVFERATLGHASAALRVDSDAADSGPGTASVAVAVSDGDTAAFADSIRDAAAIASTANPAATRAATGAPARSGNAGCVPAGTVGSASRAAATGTVKAVEHDRTSKELSPGCRVHQMRSGGRRLTDHRSFSSFLGGCKQELDTCDIGSC